MATQDVYVEWIAKLFPPQGKWSESDYFALPDSNQIIELSEGEIIMSPPPEPAHQRAVRRLAFALDSHVSEHGMGEVFFAPIAVRLRQDKIREPDILFLRNENLNSIQRTHIDAPPDWVSEVISPGSRKIDEIDKLAEYAEVGIPEYWIIDLDNKTIRVYDLEGAEYRLVATYSSGQTAESTTIEGFIILVNEVIPS